MLGQISYVISANIQPLKDGLSQAKTEMKSADGAMKSAGKSIADSSKKMSQTASTQISGVQQGLAGVSPAAGQAVGGMQKVSMAAKGLTAAMGPIGLIVMALGAAIGALTAYFKGSVDGQEKMAKIMGTLNGVMTVLKDAAIEVGRWIVWAFENPQEAVKQLWEVIKQNIINRFQGMVEMVVAGWEVISKGAAGVAKAIKGIFDSTAREEAKQLFAEMVTGMADFGEAAVKAATGIDNIGEKVSGVWDKINEKAAEGSDIAMREIKLRQDQIAAMTNIASLESQIAEARRIANDDAYELTEQIAAQEKAMELVDQKMAIQEGLAQRALQIQRDKNALGESNLDDIEKAAQLETQLINLTTARDQELRSLLRRMGTLRNQHEAEGKVVEENLKKEKDLRAGVLEEIRKAGRTEIEVLQETMNEKLDMVDWTESERAQIVQHYQSQIDAIHQEAIDKQLAAERAANDERIAEEQRVKDAKVQMQLDMLNAFAEGLSVMGQFQQAAMDRELQMAEGNEAKQAEIQKKYARKRKAISLSQAIIGTANAVINALQTQPFLPMGPIMAGLAGAMGAAQIATIAATPMKTGGIVPPGFANDTYPALLTSGETVIPAPIPLGGMGGGSLQARLVQAGPDLMIYMTEQGRTLDMSY